MLRHLRSLDRSAKLDLIKITLTELADLGVTGVWADARPFLERVERLEQAAADVSSPAKPPADVLIADRLASGALDPAEVPELLGTGPRALEAERLRRLYASGADRAAIGALEAVRAYGDRLVTECLRPAVTEALRASDANTWARLCSLATELRAARLLPCRLSAVDRVFDTWDYQFGSPVMLATNLGDRSPAELLAAAREVDAQPGIYSDQEVYERAFPPRPARAVSSGTR